MTQAAYSIPNQTAAALRLDLNNHLLAIVSQNSGAAAPSVTFAYQFWADTGVTPPMLRQRNAANAAWIAIAQLSNFGLPSVQLQSATAATTTNVGVAYSATQTPPTSGAKLVDATINADNSGALSTLALNGDAAKSIKQYSSTGTKIAAVLVAGMRATLMDDGTDWILMNPLSTGAGAPVTLASATTTDIGGQNSFAVEITGTTTITSFGTNYNGPRFLRFTGALLLTHNATTLNLPGAQNITTVAGDTCIAYPNSAANGWNVVQFQRTQNDPLAATIRAWALFDGTIGGTNAPTAGSKVTSITRHAGGGIYTVDLAVTMASANYAVVATAAAAIGTAGRVVSVDSRTTTSFRILTENTAGVVDDSAIVSFSLIGA